MKINDVKHNHSLTDLLKVLIFSILMITPLLSVATRCLYVICNKNAYQSYYGDINQNETQTIETTDNLLNSFVYISNLPIKQTNNSGNIVFSLRLDNVEVLNNPYDFALDDLNRIDVYIYTQTIDLRFYKETNTFINNSNNTNGLLQINARLTQTDITNTYLEYFQDLYYMNYDTSSYLDNVFEYSVNKLAESPIINWTSNTAVYTGVNTMTTQLGITQSVIPMLITYWFLLTIIYVILDIVLKLFTILTHMIGGKKST